MYFNKYKIQRNNGLLPKIHQKQPISLITTYCLVNKQQPKQYSVENHPSNSHMIIMFNEKEYLHRKCSFASFSNTTADIVKEMDNMYPSHSHTLTIFVVNEPKKAESMILGVNSSQCLLSKAYNHLLLSKERQNKIKLSVIGIQNQNSLTDQLSYQLLDYNNLNHQQAPLKSIIKSKQKLKILKNQQSHKYFAQNLTRQTVESQQMLNQLVRRYKDVKAHLQRWIQETQYTQYYLLGQLYHLQETQFSEQTGVQMTVRSHYILAINQYIRTTSPLMLRIGMVLRRIEEQTNKPLQIHQSKLFKVLTECFGNKAKNSIDYRFHLFMQVGQYATLKDQYVCLVPISQFLTSKAEKNVLSLAFFYTKQFMEYPQLYQIMSTLLKIKSILRQKETYPQLTEMVKERLKTKSYVCSTYSSQEKKVGKFHRLLTEQAYERLDLQDLVNETSKLYKLITPKKTPQQMSRNHSFHKQKIVPKYIPSILISILISEANQKQTVFQNRKKQFQVQSKRQNKKQIGKNLFYERTKQWVGAVYGKESYKKLKKLKKIDERTNSLIKQMLIREMDSNREDVQDIIDAII